MLFVVYTYTLDILLACFQFFRLVYIEASWKIFKFLWGFKYLKSLKILIIFLLDKKMLIVMILTLMKYCEE